jgi:hypothetical protein
MRHAMNLRRPSYAATAAVQASRESSANTTLAGRYRSRSAQINSNPQFLRTNCRSFSDASRLVHAVKRNNLQFFGLLVHHMFATCPPKLVESRLGRLHSRPVAKSGSPVMGSWTSGSKSTFYELPNAWITFAFKFATFVAHQLHEF